MFAFGENHNSAWNDEHFYLFISSSLCDINQIKRKLKFFLILTHHHTDSCVWNGIKYLTCYFYHLMVKSLLLTPDDDTVSLLMYLF